MEAGTNGDQLCNWCKHHSLYCLWPPESVHQKSCNHCAARKMVCLVQGEWVSKRKHWEPSEKGKSCSHKKLRLKWSHMLSQKAVGMVDRKHGVSKISFTLLGLNDSMEENNELLREQNGYLKRIVLSLDGGLVPGEEEVLVEEDSIMRE